MQRSISLSVFVILLVSMILVACGGDVLETGGTDGSGGNEGETYQFKLGHIAPPDHIFNDAAEKLAEKLEERSNGRMTVELYPGGQLGSEADMVQQLENGTLDLGFITNAYLTSHSEALSAWFAPFLFDSYEEAFEASNSEIAEELLATLEGTGMKPLDYFFSGHRTMMFTEKIEKPEDIQGMTLRVTPSPALEDWYRLLGASPESISLPDVYQSLQTGVIDGMEMDLDVAITNNFNEVTGYAAMTNHMVWPAVMIINEDLYESMSEEDQKIVREAMEAASEYATLKRAEQEEEFIEILTDRGMELYDMDESLFDSYKEEFDEMYKAKDPLIEEFIDTFRE